MKHWTVKTGGIEELIEADMSHIFASGALAFFNTDPSGTRMLLVAYASHAWDSVDYEGDDTPPVAPTPQDPESAQQ